MHLKCGTSLEAARPAVKPDAEEFLLDMLNDYVIQGHNSRLEVINKGPNHALITNSD